MPKVVVANAGPLMALAKLNLLHLLKQLCTLGVLIQAYHGGLITADQLRFYFGQIEERSDIWISPVLVWRLAREVLA